MKKREIYTICVFIILASLDNSALALLSPITIKVANGLGLSSDAFVFFIIAVMTFITACTSFIWGYYGGKYSRKRLLLWGTIIWAVAIFLSAFSPDVIIFTLFLIIASIGLGCIASVGFSVISDLISPKRRGLAMSLWGASQGLGSFIGYAIAVLFATSISWNFPFFFLGLITFGFIIAYFFTIEPQMGAKEEELQNMFKEGGIYEFKIKKEDLKVIFNIKTNRTLIFQGLFAQIVWGAFQSLPAVFTHRFLASNMNINSATLIGAILAGIFQLGAIFAIYFGHLGDKYEKKTLKARSIISALGSFIGVPFVIAALLIPLSFSNLPEEEGTLAIIMYLFGQIVFNPLFLIVFISAFIAAAALSADAANFMALVSEINLPEHRGTLFGFTNFINGVGRSIGLILMPTLVIYLGTSIPEPLNWVYSLAIIQLFFIPTGIFYALSAKYAPKDILNIRDILKTRAGCE